MQDPQATVVVTTRDRPGLVGEAVASALAQTVAAVEVIVVDDASAEPVRLDGAGGRLRLLRTGRPVGVCAARNRGLAAARGAWVTFLDDDDRLAPDMLERSLAAVRASTLPPPVACVSGVAEVDGAGRVVRTVAPVTLARGGGGPAGVGSGAWATVNTLVVPTAVARAIGGWDETLPAWEHVDLLLRLRAACSVQGVGQVTYWRRAHRSERLSRDLAARVEGIRRTLAKHEAAFADHPGDRARLLGALGIAWLRLGRWGPAVAATTAALRLAPLRPRAVGQWLASLAGPRLWTLVDR